MVRRRIQQDVQAGNRGCRLQLRIGYLAARAQQYLSGAFSEVRRSYPETDLKLVNLSLVEQIIALRAGKIDIGITNDRGELLAGEFFTRTRFEPTGTRADHSASTPRRRSQLRRIVRNEREISFVA
jgi:DNA-binding transcriptional LysR family regulator